ncbi:MAG: 6-phospho-3-hexuloisomerase [Nitrososphaerota archaeon]
MRPEFNEVVEEILSQVRDSLSKIDKEQIEKFIDMLVNARGRKILVSGAGRTGLVARAFAMRLMHLGYLVYVVGETITPSLEKDDILIAISGSGTTTLVVEAAKAAKIIGSKVIAITSFPESPLVQLADHTIILPGRTKTSSKTDYFSRQILGFHEPLLPLGTLFETNCLIFLDIIIVELMKELNITEEEIKKRHANIEGL